MEVIVDGDDEPQRGIDGVELGHLTAIEEAIGQHALGDNAGPVQEDGAGVGEPAGCQAQSAERDEGVAAPVGEPGMIPS